MNQLNQDSKINELSNITGYGVNYCFEILRKTNWDINEAMKYLKENPPSYKHYLNKDRYVLVRGGNGYSIYDLQAEVYILIEDDLIYKKAVSTMIENDNTILNSSDIKNYRINK